MINIHCFTNLDLINEKWPTFLPEVPRVNDLIQSATVWEWYNTAEDKCDSRIELEIVRVTWKAYQKKNEVWCDYRRTVSHTIEETIWTPHVELHLPKGRWGTLRDWYQWYGKITGKGVSFFI